MGVRARLDGECGLAGGGAMGSVVFLGLDGSDRECAHFGGDGDFWGGVGLTFEGTTSTTRVPSKSTALRRLRCPRDARHRSPLRAEDFDGTDVNGLPTLTANLATNATCFLSRIEETAYGKGDMLHSRYRCTIELMIVYFNNCNGRPHACLFGSSAFFDLETSGVNSNKARNLLPGQQCIVALYAESDDVVFHCYRFSRESVEVDTESGERVRVFHGDLQSTETMSKIAAARSDRYKCFFDKNGGFKRAAVIVEK